MSVPRENRLSNTPDAQPMGQVGTYLGGNEDKKGLLTTYQPHPREWACARPIAILASPDGAK